MMTDRHIEDGKTRVDLVGEDLPGYYDRVIISAKRAGWVFCYIDGSDIRDAYPPHQIEKVSGVVENG